MRWIFFCLLLVFGCNQINSDVVTENHSNSITEEDSIFINKTRPDENLHKKMIESCKVAGEPCGEPIVGICENGPNGLFCRINNESIRRPRPEIK